MPLTSLRAVVVFCGSRLGVDPAYVQAAERLGRGLAERGIRLVYGGGRIGLMGAVADACLAEGGQVVGVIPEFLRAREIAHGEIGELIVTDSMHTRKRRMFELSDAFIVLPGGLGTLDELFEITTWRQLGLHDKPILVCDVLGWGGLIGALMGGVVNAGFADRSALALFEIVADVEGVLDRLDRLGPPSPGQPARL